MSEHIDQWARVGWLLARAGCSLVDRGQVWEWVDEYGNSYCVERGVLDYPPEIPDEYMEKLPTWMR